MNAQYMAQIKSVAEDALADYDFGDGVVACDCGTLQAEIDAEGVDFTTAIYAESDDAKPSDDSFRLSFHCRFKPGKTVPADVYALSMSNGSEVGRPGSCTQLDVEEVLMTYELFCKKVMDLLLTRPVRTGFVLGKGCIALDNGSLVAIADGAEWDDSTPIDLSAWGVGAFDGMTPEEMKAAFDQPKFITFGVESASSDLTKIELAEGKYTVIHRHGTEFQALRYGEPWRDLTGDGLILAMCQEIEALKFAAKVRDNDVKAIFKSLVQEYGSRGGPADALLPAEDQPQALRSAMAYLAT